MTAFENAEHAEDVLPLNELLARCERLESGLLREQLADADAIDAQRPGGRENPYTTPLAWLDFYTWLHRTHVEAVRRRAQSLASSPAAAASLEEVLGDALAEKPVAVELSIGETVYVYPKSYDTLRFCNHLDAQLRLIHEEWALAREIVEHGEPSAADRTVEAIAPLMESRTVRLWSWILTDDRAELPFREDHPLPEPPDWTRKLSPIDLFALLRAHVQVNATRLRIIAAAFPPEAASKPDTPRLTLAGFLGSVAADHPPGAARDLLRKTSLGQVFAAQVAAAHAHREALNQARETRD